MAAEYVYNEQQLVAFGSNVLLLDSIPCRRGCVMHENGTGILTLRGPVFDGRNFNAKAQYKVTGNMNIAIPTGQTVGAISVAIAQNGEEIPTSKAISTPGAVEEFQQVSIDKIVTVSVGCCNTIAIENVLPGIDPATEIGGAILVRNVNLTVARIA